MQTTTQREPTPRTNAAGIKFCENQEGQKKDKNSGKQRRINRRPSQ